MTFIPMATQVELIASGYEWECPACECLNLIAEYPCEQKVKCQKCGEEFTAALPEHCFD